MHHPAPAAAAHPRPPEILLPRGAAAAGPLGRQRWSARRREAPRGPNRHRLRRGGAPPRMQTRTPCSSSCSWTVSAAGTVPSQAHPAELR
eukprot:2514557-Prymnesium_polylepis.2